MSNSNPSINIIVLNWNGWDDTKECIKSIIKSSYENYKIIVVDNGSEPKSINNFVNWAENKFKQFIIYDRPQAELGGVNENEKESDKIPSNEKLVLILNNENLGFAKGNNVGIKYSEKINADLVFLLNNDTVVTENAINILVKFLKCNEDYSVAIPQIRYFEPKNLIWNCGGKIYWFGNKRYYYTKKDYNRVPQEGFKNISFATGCALLFDYKKTGNLTEKFFFGEEDFEFSLRMKMIGVKMACVFNSLIYHKVGRSINSSSSNSIGKIEIHYLNRFINLKDYNNKFKWFFLILLNLIFISINLIFKRHLKIKVVIQLIKDLIKYSVKLTEVNKDTFNLILNKEF